MDIASDPRRVQAMDMGRYPEVVPMTRPTGHCKRPTIVARVQAMDTASDPTMFQKSASNRPVAQNNGT